MKLTQVYPRPRCLRPETCPGLSQNHSHSTRPPGNYDRRRSREKRPSARRDNRACRPQILPEYAPSSRLGLKPNPSQRRRSHFFIALPELIQESDYSCEFIPLVSPRRPPRKVSMTPPPLPGSENRIRSFIGPTRAVPIAAFPGSPPSTPQRARARNAEHPRETASTSALWPASSGPRHALPNSRPLPAPTRRAQEDSRGPVARRRIA